MLASLFSLLPEWLEPGIPTAELDGIIERHITRAGARSAFMTLSGYHHASCISINDEIAHGVPHRKRILAEGDLVKVDVGVSLRGYFADACRSYCVGECDHDTTNLLRAGEAALTAAVDNFKEAASLYDVAAAVQDRAAQEGFHVIRGVSGHGVGFALHEAPRIPFIPSIATREPLPVGSVAALEPALSSRTADSLLDENGVLRTADGSRAVQFEDTVAITSRGVAVLSRY